MTVDEPREGADLAPGLDARSAAASPDALDSLDDTALRAIAYGRVVNDGDRMRARTASRILANRHASVMPGPRVVDEGTGGGLRSGPGGLGGRDGLGGLGGRDGLGGSAEFGADDEDYGHRSGHSAGGSAGDSSGSSAGDSTGDSTHGSDGAHRPGSRRRSLLIAAVIAALVAGGALGVAAGPLVESLQPDSLAVFDRPATDEETAALARILDVSTGEARLLTELDDVRVYGVRTDAGVFFGTGELGTEICVIGDTDDDTVQFILFNCVPEQVFRDHGMSGVLSAFKLSGSGFTPSIARTLAFQWGPRGDLQLEDISADVLTTTTDRFSEQDLAQGLDIPLVQVIREQEPDPAIGRELPGALFGPVDIGTVSAGAGVEARMWGSIFPDSDGSDGVAVCLSAEVEAELVAHECQSMAVFRTEGVDAQFFRGDALITASVGPSGAVSAVIEE